MSDPVNTPVEYVGVGIFVILWGLGVGSWFYSVWESIGMFRLKPSAFERGRLVLSTMRALPQPEPTTFPHEKVTTDTGQFRFVSPTECLFSPRFSWFRLRVHTPFPIKGRIRFRGSHAEIEGRLPLGPSLFFGAWVLAWPIIPTCLFMAGKASIVQTVLFISVGLGGALGMVAFSLAVERRRAETIVHEIELHLAKRAA